MSDNKDSLRKFLEDMDNGFLLVDCGDSIMEIRKENDALVVEWGSSTVKVSVDRAIELIEEGENRASRLGKSEHE